MFGLPGGEILDFIEAARRVGIEFLLTRHEAAAAFMADVTGQITRRPGVCVSTLGPGAMNLTLGVANAYLDRSPVIAITASTGRAAEPYATHQKLDLNAVYRPITKLTMTLDGEDTAAKVRHAIRTSVTPRMGPVHLALPSDVARAEDRETASTLDDATSDSVGPAWLAASSSVGSASLPASTRPPEAPSSLTAVLDAIAHARRPVLIVGLDLDPRAHAGSVATLVNTLAVPTFVTPKAKGLLPEDHPLFCGVCAGVAGDGAIVDFFAGADLLIGLGFEPVESDKLWHHTMKLVSLGPMSIAADDYRPYAEATGDVDAMVEAVCARRPGPFAWTAEDLDTFRRELRDVLRPARPPHPSTLRLTQGRPEPGRGATSSGRPEPGQGRGLSPYDLTRRLRELLPRDTICSTDVGSIKLITSQAWASYAPLTFFESNGLSAMGYSLPAAMAARLQFPQTPVLCTIGDGGFSMTIGELETCVRERLHFMTVVYNDSALSLIDVAQQRRGYPTCGVRYGTVDFAAAASAFGAWARRVDSIDDLDAAVREGLRIDRPVVIDAVVDPGEYAAHARPPQRSRRPGAE